MFCDGGRERKLKCALRLAAELEWTCAKPALRVVLR